MLIELRDARRVHVEVTGAGHPVVLVHGFGASGDAWGGPLLEHLAEGGRVVALDLLGHGESDQPHDPPRYLADEIVRDLIEVADRLSVRRATWVGYSMGGRAALALAVAYPDRVAGLVLEGATAGIEAADERDARVARDEDIAQLLEDQGIEVFAEYWRKQPVFESRRRLAPAIRADIKRRLLENDPAALAACLRGFGRGVQPSYWSALPSLDVPVTVLSGSEDDASRDIAERMAAALPRATLTIIPDVGHTVHIENPAAWLEAVQTALAEAGAG